jgi:hypothetical protein
MTLVDSDGTVHATRKDWECYSRTPDSVIEEINALVYAVITTNSDPVIAQKIIYDTIESKGYGKYGLRDSECDQCTTNIINQYYGSNIDRWADLSLKAEKKGQKWIHKSDGNYVTVEVSTSRVSKEQSIGRVNREPKENKTVKGLSNKTIDKLSHALKEDVINYIQNDDRYAEFMQEVLNDAIHNYLGQIDPVLLMELNCSLFDAIDLR